MIGIGRPATGPSDVRPIYEQSPDDRESDNVRYDVWSLLKPYRNKSNYREREPQLMRGPPWGRSPEDVRDIVHSDNMARSDRAKMAFDRSEGYSPYAVLNRISRAKSQISAPGHERVWNEFARENPGDLDDLGYLIDPEAFYSPDPAKR
jgi:hypothetical protein